MSVCFCQTHSVTYDRALSHTWRLRNRTPTCAHTVDEGHRLLFTCWRHAAEQEGVYFSSKNSLHSSLVARSIYSKRSEPIPMKMDSRYGLLCVVALQKSLSAKRTRAISSYPNNPAKFVKPPGCQIHVKSTISGLSCPPANKNNNFSKFLSMGKSQQHSSISLSEPHRRTLAEAAGWELTCFLFWWTRGTRKMDAKENNSGQEDDWEEALRYLEGIDSRSKVYSGRWNKSTLRMRRKLFLLVR